MAVIDRIRPLLDAALAGSGLLVEEVSVTPAGRRRVVRVIVDRVLEADGDVTTPTSPLGLDEVAEATRAVGDALDDSDVLGDAPYTLEVTSPGVGRPLTAPRHFQRNVGRLLTLTLLDGRQITGRLRRSGATDLTLEIPAHDKVPAGRRDLRYGELGRAVVEVEFARGDADDGDGEKET